MIVDVSSLNHHPLNQKIYTLSSIDDLVDSIGKVGLLQPLVINQSNQIISGNRRFEAIKRLGWSTVDVSQVDIPLSDEELMLVHFNKQRIKTSKELLNEYDILYKYYGKGQGRRTDLTSVQMDKGSTRDMISEEIGISSGQLARLLFIRKHNEELIELIDKGVMTIHQSYLQIQRELKEDEFLNQSGPSVGIKTTNWSCYQKSSHQMDEVSDESIQTIYTSPPYWNKRKYIKEGGLGNETTSDEFVSNLIEHLNDCWRVLNPKGSFFLNLGDTFFQGNLQNVPHRVVLGLQQKGWILRNTIIWSKTNPKPSSSKSNLTPTYEFIFHLVKQLEYDYYPTLTPLRQSTKPSHPPRHRSMNGKHKSSTPYIPNIKGKNMGDFWSQDIVSSSVSNQSKIKSLKEHPAPFPQEIVILPILQTSKEGQMVLDPFMGSGTVGRVCDLLMRKFTGYDIINLSNLH